MRYLIVTKLDWTRPMSVTDQWRDGEPADMNIVGLTGGIASGKSTVTKILQDLGEVVICADELARAAVLRGQPGLQQVVHAFGPSVLDSDGNLDRKKLGGIVFGQPEKLQRLEQIIHPIVRRLFQAKVKELEGRGSSRVFYDVPLLFEKDMQKQFNGVLLVYCRPEQQVERLMQRDNLSLDQALVRVKAQLPIDEKLLRATWVIDNSGSAQTLPGQVKEILLQIRTGLDENHQAQE